MRAWRIYIHSDPRRRFAVAVAFMLMSGLGFAVMNLFVRLSGDLPTVQKSFFRNVTVFIVAFGILCQGHQKGLPLIHRKGDLFWLVLRSIFGTIGILANFFTVDHMPIADASVINKLSPFFTILFAATFLKDRPNRAQVLGIVIAFLGVLFLIQPDGQALDRAHLLPIVVGLFGATAAGGAYTTVRYLGMRKVDGSFMIAFFAGFSCLAMAPFVATSYVPMTKTQWLYMFIVGLGAVVGQYGVTYAYRFAKASEVSIFDYSNVIFTTLLGIVVLSQVPTASTLIGGGLVFCALFVIFLYNLRLENKRHKKDGLR